MLPVTSLIWNANACEGTTRQRKCQIYVVFVSSVCLVLKSTEAVLELMTGMTCRGVNWGVNTFSIMDSSAVIRGNSEATQHYHIGLREFRLLKKTLVVGVLQEPIYCCKHALYEVLVTRERRNHALLSAKGV